MTPTWEEYARQRDAEAIVLKHDVERLTAENERLRAALKGLIDSADACAWSANIGTMDAAIDAARSALNQQQAVNSEEGK